MKMWLKKAFEKIGLNINYGRQVVVSEDRSPIKMGDKCVYDPKRGKRICPPKERLKGLKMKKSEANKE